MCGIVGLWYLDGPPLSQTQLNNFNNTLAHRGPDGSDIYIDKESNLGLGQRRLAILDTSDSGRQPMPYANQRYWITFNGEIYNFIELKNELVQSGYRFYTEADTEVVMAAYDKWGEDCQLRLNGMWAFAIWDSREKRLFLSRDRFGVKPMHYYFDGSKFAFASEMKAFLALEWFNLEFIPEMVAAALINDESVEGTERCLLRGVNRLPGGHCLFLDRSCDLKVRRWWNTLEHLQSVPARYDDQVAEYRELYLDACRIRMRSDVPIGTSLSGGLDSSSIVCAMHHVRTTGKAGPRLASEWQKAFVATYPGSVIDERKYADEVIRKTRVDPIYCSITPQMYLDYFERILFQFEEISDIFLGPWLVHKTQREHGVIVTLDGHGGDEALGGYPWHVTSLIRDNLRMLSPWKTMELVKTIQNMELFPSGKFITGSIKRIGSRWYKHLIGEDGSEWLNYTPDRVESRAFIEDAPNLKSRDNLFRRLYIDFHFTQLPMNLRDFDRLSMAHGVEVRSPFMDWRLVSYSFSIPPQSKIRGGFTKKILRDAMIGLLPEAVRTRTSKLGFPNLVESWSSPPARKFIQDVVSSTDFQTSQIWNGGRIRKFLDRAVKRNELEQIHRVWTFVQAMSLMKLFRDKWRSYR